MMIGIFSFRNWLFTLLMAVKEEEGEGAASAASMAAWSLFDGVDVDVGGGELVWLRRTLRKSACAEAGSVVDSSCTYGSAVVFTLPSTKSPKSMSRYTFRTAAGFSECKNIGGLGAHGMMSPRSSRNLQTHWKSWAGTRERCWTMYITWMSSKTYRTEAGDTIRVCPGVVRIRVEGMNGIQLAANLERQVDLGIAWYEPYLAHTVHEL
jgi:hypothetical protein